MSGAASVPLPQLTARAIVLGVVLSVVLAGANAYLGLFAGLTVSASIPAAVVSMAVLKLFKDSNILENNIVQTAASSGEAVAAGVIFTIPALVLLQFWDTFDYLWVTAIAGLGGLLGVAFTIPLRRALIVEQQLAFPEGTATAEVLKLGEASAGARFLVVAAIVGAAVKLAETGLRLWAGTAQAAAYVGSSTIAYVGTNLSPALIGVGYIVGLNIAVLVFLGGAISWYVAIPLYSALYLPSDPVLGPQLAAGTPAAELAFAIWSAKIRYLGVGAMLIGGIAALIGMRASLWGVMRMGLARRSAAPALDHRDRDAPMRLVLLGIAVLVVPIFVLYQAIVGTLGVAVAMTLVMVTAGFLFSAVAGYMAGLVGSSNNPISGVTIATILLTALLLLGLLGTDGTATGPAAAIMVGAVVCCAAAMGGDNLQDLKAGYLLGATPWRQQVAQVIGVVASALVMAVILNLLLEAYGIGAPTAERPGSLLAPQATLMASVAQGVFGAGLPWAWVFAGVGVGAGIIAFDAWLRRQGAGWRAPVLAVAVGIYLPLELSVPIFAGGLIAHFAARRGRGDPADRARHGLLFAAGLITGEALIGIIMALPIVIFQDPDVIALGVRVPLLLGLAVVAAVAAALYSVAAGRRAR